MLSLKRVLGFIGTCILTMKLRSQMPCAQIPRYKCSAQIQNFGIIAIRATGFSYPIAQSPNSIAQMVELYLYLYFSHSHLGYRKIKSHSPTEFFIALAIGRLLVLHTVVRKTRCSSQCHFSRTLWRVRGEIKMAIGDHNNLARE